MKNDTNAYALELLIAKFLRWGVFFCGALILVGWLLQINWHANPFVVYKDYDPIPFWDLISHYLKRGNYGGLLAYAGLVGLVSLPVWRVFLTGVLFLRQKERALALIAFVVFTLLVISFLLGVSVE